MTARLVTTPQPQNEPDKAPRRVTSEQLLGAQRALVITHNGRDYQLRLTQNGKLILTA